MEGASPLAPDDLSFSGPKLLRPIPVRNAPTRRVRRSGCAPPASQPLLAKRPSLDGVEVNDIQAMVAELRRRDVMFEEVDVPGL